MSPHKPHSASIVSTSRLFGMELLYYRMGMDLHRIARAEVIVCWFLWFAPIVFRILRAPKRDVIATAGNWKWGMLLQAAGYGVLWIRTTPRNPSPLVIIAMLAAPLSVLCVFLAVRHLGRQWRIKAGLYADHELVRTGPYRLVRHPIYAAMLAMLLATGFVFTPWPLLVAALVPFLIGTEMRVRTEDALLASHFGETFVAYKAAVAAYIPFVR